MKSGLVRIVLGVAFIAMQSTAQNIQIDSFAENGTITWSNPSVGTTCAVEWASSLTGSWHRSWNELAQILITNPVASARVPMFYRVVSTPPADLANGLMAYYPFNGDVRDASSNGHDGVCHGAAWTPDRHGNANRALLFNGTSNDFVEVGVIAIQIPVTVSVWFKTSAANSQWRTLLSWHETTPPFAGIGIAANGDGYLRTRIGNDTTDVLTTNRVDGDGQWHMITISRDTLSTYRVFVDGLLQTEQSVSASIGVDHTLFIGKSFRPDSWNEHFQGALDEIRLYNRALTEQEVWQLRTYSP